MLRERFNLCCGVLMNICVSAPGEVRQDSESSFDSLASLMLEVVTKGETA